MKNRQVNLTAPPTGRPGAVARANAIILAALLLSGIFIVAARVLAAQGLISPSASNWITLVSLAIIVATVVFQAVAHSRRSAARRNELRLSLERELSVTIRGGGVSRLSADQKKRIRRLFLRLPEVKPGGSIKRTLEGKRADQSLIGFEHVHFIHTGQTAIPVTHTIYALQSSHWPRVDITPKRRFHRLLGMILRTHAIELDLPEFNARFRVVSDDSDFVVTLLSPELQRLILEKPDVAWRLIDGWVCLIYRGSMRYDRAASSIHRLEMFSGLIPPELAHWTAPHSV